MTRRTLPLGTYVPGVGKRVKVRWSEIAWDEEDPPPGLKAKMQDPSTPFGDPPPGFCRVVGMFVDPATGKLLVQWDEAPMP